MSALLSRLLFGDSMPLLGYLRLFSRPLFGLIDHGQVFHISALQALLVPAVVISIEIQVAAAFRAASHGILFSHNISSFYEAFQLQLAVSSIDC